MVEMEGQEEEREVGEDRVGLSCTLDMFREQKEVMQMFHSLQAAVHTPLTAEKAFEDLKRTLDNYQEQPHLLDPHLEGMLGYLVDVTRSPNLSSPVLAQAFKYLWLVTKVRGHKIIFKKLPHEVKDLLPVLQMLETKDMSQDFFSSYMLLLWLSIIIYMPFNMLGLDASTQQTLDTTNTTTVVHRIYSVIKTHLQSAQKSREMAAYLAARFFTRPDLKDKFLPQFIDYCFEVLETGDQDVRRVFHKLGVLRALGLVFKQGKREELLQYSHTTLTRLVQSGVLSSSDTPIRKLAIKLLQRIGLTFLRPRVAAWRYQRGSRSLAMNVEGSTPTQTTQASSQSQEEDEEVEAEVEEVVDCLLQALKDKDTVVRWSGAKGIGRVTGRLPQEFGDEVVGAILELFSTRESDRAWHGGCLALAELARRGLLLPDRLGEVTPVIEKALVYDELRGQCSVGSNIRDAACYLCWAFARAYHPDQMLPYVNQLATGLLIVALFDREIPCRRAGSAAFQEHVGRQGAFPHGIEILTIVDYFAVGNRSNAFFKLSVEVARHPEYTQALIDHLVSRKINHWDSTIRELAAKALHNLTPLAPHHVATKVMPRLLELATGPILVERHGAILALAHSLQALASTAPTLATSLQDLVGAGVLEGVAGVVPRLQERQLYRGMGGEYMRQASAVLVEKCSLACAPFHHQPIVGTWEQLLEECMVYPEDNIRVAALEALPPFWTTYYPLTSPQQQQWHQDLIARYTAALNTDKEIHRLGYTAALGCLPQALVKGHFDTVLGALLGATTITPETVTWAQTRKQAILSILRLVHTVGISTQATEKEGVCGGNLNCIYEALLASLDDYTMDRRGDIGAWVREAAITTLQVVTELVVREEAELLQEATVGELMARVCQQAVERIDRTRKVAGSAFSALLYSSPRLPYIPHVEELERVFPQKLCEEINWASEKSTFNLFVQLLDFPVYRSRLLLGITYSAGGISANLSRYTNEAMQEYLITRAEKEELLRAFLTTVLDLFSAHQKVDRITLPLIKTLADLLSSSTMLDPLLEEEGLVLRLVGVLKKECYRSTDYHKLAAVVMVLCELLRVGGPSTRPCLTQLSLFLGYQYPKVRAVAASSLLAALQEYNDQGLVEEEKLPEVTTILEETEWMNDIEEARRQRTRLCHLLDIHPPQLRKK